MKRKMTCRHCGAEIMETDHGQWVSAKSTRPYYCGLRYKPYQKHEPRP